MPDMEFVVFALSIRDAVPAPWQRAFRPSFCCLAPIKDGI